MKRYAIEFNGYDYVILDRDSVIAAFATLDEAYNAMRDFEEKTSCAVELKVPPAMRWAKQNLYVQA
ncbi:hypothetical protein J3998_09950 [Thiomicrorhabdus sp. 6S2-11]|jgi:hypothetical protein|uniref:Phage protein n=1 Tax=Thiomicrorhabdus marina TaxID=2818442 RepID=A0ABS3Q6C6_9GAMM|nr:hypothetical protein [Thiomicrorhabdus marina]MBO1927898.1 hypothetical protein [Thiomicrorhabdus marina]